MNITIRQALADDIDELLEWRMEVLRHVFDIPDNENIKDLYLANREYYQKSMPGGNHIAIFAEMGHAVIGCGGLCLYQEMPSPDNPAGQCAYLMNIYTRKEYRGQGAGKAVVRWLVGYARKQGISKIYLETSACGRALYESIGFQDMKDYMKL